MACRLLPLRWPRAQLYTRRGEQLQDAYRMLHQRIGVFTALPIRSLDRLSLQQRLREIGNMDDTTVKRDMFGRCLADRQ